MSRSTFDSGDPPPIMTGGYPEYPAGGAEPETAVERAATRKTGFAPNERYERPTAPGPDDAEPREIEGRHAEPFAFGMKGQATVGWGAGSGPRARGKAGAPAPNGR
jgi:hypothetical protein